MERTTLGQLARRDARDISLVQVYPAPLSLPRHSIIAAMTIRLRGAG
jgi:hypothetical protein